MWIASQFGFYSIVRKGDMIHVRARVRGDLERLLQLIPLESPIQQDTGTDYRFRLVVAPWVLEHILAALAGTVDYPNFKSRIGELEHQRPKLAAYETLWTGLWQVQQDMERTEAPRVGRQVRGKR